MTLPQNIQRHLESLPPDKQAEFFDFTLFLESRAKHHMKYHTQSTSVRDSDDSLHVYEPNYVPFGDTEYERF